MTNQSAFKVSNPRLLLLSYATRAWVLLALKPAYKFGSTDPKAAQREQPYEDGLMKASRFSLYKACNPL